MVIFQKTKPWSRAWSPLLLLSLSILSLPVPSISRRGYSHHTSAMVLFPSSAQLTTESRNLELLGQRLVIGRN